MKQFLYDRNPNSQISNFILLLKKVQNNDFVTRILGKILMLKL